MRTSVVCENNHTGLVRWDDRKHFPESRTGIERTTVASDTVPIKPTIDRQSAHTISETGSDHSTGDSGLNTSPEGWSSTTDSVAWLILLRGIGSLCAEIHSCRYLSSCTNESWYHPENPLECIDRRTTTRFDQR